MKEIDPKIPKGDEYKIRKMLLACTQLRRYEKRKTGEELIYLTVKRPRNEKRYVQLLSMYPFVCSALKF